MNQHMDLVHPLYTIIGVMGTNRSLLLRTIMEPEHNFMQDPSHERQSARYTGSLFWLRSSLDKGYQVPITSQLRTFHNPHIYYSITPAHPVTGLLHLPASPSVGASDDTRRLCQLSSSFSVATDIIRVTL